MNKKKNKKNIIIIVAALVLLLVVGILVFLRYKDNKTELSLSDKKWIEDNKKSMIDIYVMNDLPVFSLEEGDIFLSFLDYFEAETGLSLNRVSYSLNSSEPKTNYLFKIIKETDDLGRNDLLFYEDNYVIISKENKKIQDISKLEGYKIGVLTTSMTSISEYLTYGNNLTFTNYEDDVQLLNAFNSNEVNYIIIPKNRYLKEIVTNNYYIVNNLTSLTNKYVLTLSNNNTKLNEIFIKMYNKWYRKNFSRLYSTKMNDFYYKAKNIDEKDKSNFKGKKYIYGYVENIPYEISNTKGINLEFLNGFEKFAGVEFQYKKYNSIKQLTKGFENGDVDIIFNYYGIDSQGSNETINVYDASYVILTHIDNNVTVDSWMSLTNKEIYALKDTMLTEYVNNNSKATIKAYSKISSLLKNKEPLILLDMNTYNYYKNTKLKDYYIVYEGKADINYNFLIKRDSTNNIFSDIFQYYLTNINPNNKSIRYSKTLNIAGNLDTNKSNYIRELNGVDKTINFNLYGLNFDKNVLTSEAIHYKGAFPSDEIPSQLTEGFGLVWDGNTASCCAGNTGEYLKYNNPHKLSLYMVSGLPVVIWSQAAEAEFVKCNNVGLVVDSIEDFSIKFDNLSENDYYKMVENAKNVSYKLRNGEYLRKVIQDIIKDLK